MGKERGTQEKKTTGRKLNWGFDIDMKKHYEAVFDIAGFQLTEVSKRKSNNLVKNGCWDKGAKDVTNIYQDQIQPMEWNKPHKRPMCQMMEDLLGDLQV